MDFFVYGTLGTRTVAADVLSTVEYGPDAVLEGLSRVDGQYPTLAPGGRTDGRILRTNEVGRLDRYEGVEQGLYVRVRVPRVDGGWVQTYVGDPEALAVPVTWPRQGALADRVQTYIRDHGVAVRVEG